MSRMPERRGCPSRRSLAKGVARLLSLALLAAPAAFAEAMEGGRANMNIHYVEIVTRDVATQVDALQTLHGLSFGEENPDLGMARVAERADGSLVGVRAPLAEQDMPVVRTYVEVDDIAAAVAEAEAAGALIAYGPMEQGDTGTWAIYFIGDAQMGLWQRPAGATRDP